MINRPKLCFPKWIHIKYKSSFILEVDSFSVIYIHIGAIIQAEKNSFCWFQSKNWKFIHWNYSFSNLYKVKNVSGIGNLTLESNFYIQIGNNSLLFVDNKCSLFIWNLINLYSDLTHSLATTIIETEASAAKALFTLDLKIIFQDFPCYLDGWISLMWSRTGTETE